VNLFGVFLGMRAAVPAMRRRGGGSIVNVASIDGFVALPNVASYNASKFGVRGLTKTGAVELGAHGIRVNAICPGAIDTPMTAPRTAPDGQVIDPKDSLGNVPLGRVGTTREVSLLAVYLASDESTFCTGGDFVIDGGWIAGPMEASLPPPRA
jgi:3alpha(or 20beta)-hydroxysteroid dehydrogenase